jgi:hypothetical protein
MPLQLAQSYAKRISKNNLLPTYVAAVITVRYAYSTLRPEAFLPDDNRNDIFWIHQFANKFVTKSFHQ